MVRAVDATEHGDLAIAFTGGYTLRVFLDSSREEAWRLFSPGKGTPQFVLRARRS